MKSRFRSLRWLFTSFLVGALFAGTLAAPAQAATTTDLEYLDRAIELSSTWRDGATVTGISNPFTGTFTASDGPHANETVQTAGWTVSDTSGAYSVIVLLYDQPWISSFQGDSTGTFVGGAWELAALDPNAPVSSGTNETSVVLADPLACAIGTGAASGAVGTIACIPLTPVGQVICGTVAGAVGGLVGYVICQDVTKGEGVHIDQTCYPTDRCKVILTVRSLNKRAASVNVDAYWDLKGQTGVGGAIPCRPACGDHAITTHSNSAAQYVSTTYIVDPDDPTVNQPLYEYKFTFTIVGAPTCFVHNTVAVWAFYTVNLENATRKLYNEQGSTKNHVYCAF